MNVKNCEIHHYKRILHKYMFYKQITVMALIRKAKKRYA